jgi:hypothetical protein
MHELKRATSLGLQSSGKDKNMVPTYQMDGLTSGDLRGSPCVKAVVALKQALFKRFHCCLCPLRLTQGQALALVSPLALVKTVFSLVGRVTG